VSEIPRLDPFSLANSFRSRKRSGVPPASREAGVAQLDGAIVAAASDGRPPVPRFVVAGRSPLKSFFIGVDHGVGAAGSINFTVSIRFDRRPSMCSIEPPRVAHDAFGVGYGAGIWAVSLAASSKVVPGLPSIM
jgi:hypothetical protein